MTPCEEITTFKTDLAKHIGFKHLCEDCYKAYKEDFCFCSKCKKHFKIEDVRKEHPLTVNVLQEHYIEDEKYDFIDHDYYY